MDKDLLQNAKAPMIALIEKKNNMKTRTKRAAALLLMLGLIMPLAVQAQDFGNPSRAIDECRKPTELTVSQITTNSAQLSWIENGEATAWQICVNDDEENLIDADTNPYALTGLNPVTEYTVKVRANCGSEQSAWSTGLTFTTPCEAFVALPYSYGFENAGNLDCWEVIATSSLTGIATVDDAPEGSKVFRFFCAEQNAYLASPVFSGTEQGLDVAFQYMNRSIWSPYTEQFQVGYTTDEGAAPADFIYGETIYGENQWVTYENTFPPNTKRIAIKYIYLGYDSDPRYLRLDDFNFEPASSSCIRPFNLTAGTPGPHSVELSWTENGTATTWQIGYQAVGGTEQYVEVTENPYTLTGLNPGTDYKVRVQAKCGDGEYSPFTSFVSFTTRCEAFDLPYSYGFEDASELDCWEVIATYYPSFTGIGNANDAPEGSKVFSFWYTEQNAYLASPMFSGTEQGLDVAFQYMNYSTTTPYTEQFQVGYTTDAGTAPADFTYGETIHGENHWVTYENTFPANTKRIAIKYIYTGGELLRLDDFNFEVASSFCPRPFNLTAGPGPHSVELSWTETGEATAWQICLNDDEENLIDADTNPYTLTGLTPVTEYTVKVRADCGSEQSAWSNGLTFTTPCGTFALPYSYGFEDASDLDCWEVIATSSSTGIATANDAPEGSKVFRFHYTEQNAYLASPVFSGTEQGLVVEFQYMNSSTTTSYTEQFQVGYTTDAGAAPADFTYGETIYGENQWVMYENTFPPNTKRIAIKYIYTNGYFLRLDDFNFEAVPSCPRPTNLTAGTPGLHSVELSWTETGEATAWQICLNDDEENLIDADTNPYTLTGLNPGTEYTVKVRANCGAEQSAWSYGLTFTTLCFALPYSYGFEDAGDLDCWEVIATSPYTGIATANDAPEGSKVFYFDGIEQIAYLASPVFSGTEQGLDVAFQYMNAFTGTPYTAQFQVGYTTDAGAAPADFTYGDTIHGENQWVWYENTFPANTKRIAIKYIYTEGLDLRLDDFNFGSASCPRPRDLAADNITTTTADLSWTENGTATTWQIGYQAVGGTEQYVEVTENPYTLTGLTPGTVYKVRVQAKCGYGEYSPFTSFVSFTTPCEAFALPYSYGFEDAGELNCWEVIATSPYTGITTSNDAPEGEKVFRFHYTEQNAYLASPVFSGTELGLVVEFQYMNSSTTSNYAEQFQVGYTTDADAAPADFTYGETIYGENHWVTYANAFPANTKRIAIKYIYTYGMYLRLDDFNFTEPNPCGRPTGLTASYNGDGTATATWVGIGNSYTIDINGSVADTVTTPCYTFGVESSTTYTIKVKATCGTEWTAPFSFTTPCIPYKITLDAPYFESFESPEGTLWTQHGLLPPCWEGYNNPSYPTPHNTIGSYGAPHIIHSGEQCLSFCNEDGDSYAILPEFSNPISDLQINFWMATNGNTTDKLRLGYITTEDDGTCNTFTEIASYDSNFGSMVQRSKILENVPAEAYRLTFKWSTSYYYLCFIDDVEVSINPAATFPPHDIAASNITPHEADITWEGYCDSYALRYREIPTLLKEGFEGGTMPEGWTIEGDNQDPTKTWRVGVGDHSNGTGTHSGNYNALITQNARNQVTYLVTPALDLGEYASAELSFWYVNRIWSNRTDEFAVCYRIGSEGGWTELWSTAENHESWTSQTVALTGLGDNCQIGFRYTDHYGWGVGLDDIVLCDPTHFEWIAVGEAESPHTLTGLTTETTYEVQVKSNCAGYDDWSESVVFTTLEACPVPFNVAVSGITATSAAVSWTGFNDSYNLSYRRAPIAETPLNEGFEGDTIPQGWTIEGDNQDPAKTWRIGVGDYSSETGTHSGNYNALITHNTNNQVTYLVTPALDLGEYGSMELSFWYINRKWVNDIDEFAVCYRIGSEGGWNELWSTAENHDTWTSQTVELTGLADNYQIGFRFTDHFGYGVGLDDIALFDMTHSNWITLSEAENPHTLTGLMPETEYEVKVQSVCEGEPTEWSESAYFTTEEGLSLTKDIAGYGTGAGGYYLIASPVMEAVTPTAGNGFLTNAFDLYRFNQSEELEWENWKAQGEQYHFNLESGRGYLYANSEDVTLTFVGTPHPATEPVEVPLAYDANANLAGWNLVGNPFAEPAFVDLDFYTMNSGGTEIIASTSTTVEAMEGIFVIAEGENESVTFTKADDGAKGANLVLNISYGRGIIDRAIVHFDSHRTLPKFQLNPSSTKVYIPQGGKDYAVVNVGRDAAHHLSTMDVNFKAAKNGTYTLTFDMENVAFDYLHLIDNLTGADVDLLAVEPVDHSVVEPVETPTQGNAPSALRQAQGPRTSVSYTFTALTTDYASRFKLVFVANDGDGPSTGSGSFAYISNGNIVINGEGTLQVIDMMGRVIRCTDVARNVSTSGLPAGVYVLRLIDGKDVMIQKIVIE
jgi:hypothetical protein